MQKITNANIKRPLSLTILGWIIIGSNIFSLIFSLGLILSGKWWLLGDLAFNLLIGFGILKGKNWVRRLYLISLPIAYLLWWQRVFHLGLRAMIIGGLITVAFNAATVYFLYRPPASVFFKRNSVQVTGRARRR